MSVAGNLGRQTFPVPIGSIFLFAGALPTIPVTYLVCDGSAFDAVKYPLLADALGGSNTPDLQQKIIGGGPIIDVGQLVPAVSGTFTAGSFTLTKENIPSVPFTPTVPEGASISTVISAVEGQSPNFLTDPLTTQGSITDGEGNAPPLNGSPALTPIGDATYNLPTSASFDNDTPSAVTPTVTLSGDATNPACLVFRYIIKAEY